MEEYCVWKYCGKIGINTFCMLFVFRMLTAVDIPKY